MSYMNVYSRFASRLVSWERPTQYFAVGMPTLSKAMHLQWQPTILCGFIEGDDA